jgi:KipI family sensor histidine kinase inhibitor
MVNLQDVRFQSASDRSLLVSFGDQITHECHEHVAKLAHLLASEAISGVRNSHPAYSSLLVVFDPLRWTHGELEGVLRGHLERTQELRLPDPRRVEILVCYGGEHGPDLSDVAALHGITAERIIDLHSSAEYIVYFLGFVPGFAYLGEVADELVTPRLATPSAQRAPGKRWDCWQADRRVSAAVSWRMEVDWENAIGNVRSRERQSAGDRGPGALYTDFQRSVCTFGTCRIARG